MFTRQKMFLVAVLFCIVPGCSNTKVSPTTTATLPPEESILPTPSLFHPTETLTSTAIPATDTPPPPTDIPPTATPWPEVINPGPHDIRALLILPQNVGPNWYLVEDNYELFGWNLTLAGARELIPPCPSAKNFYNLQNAAVDFLLPDIGDLDQYHAVAIMPASKKNQNPYGDLLDSPEALDLLRAADGDGKGVYASCGGVRVLAAAGILDGRVVTGEPTYQDEYEAAGATYAGDNIPPVIDDNLVTARRGLYYNIEDSEALAVALENSMPLETGDTKENLTEAYEIPERDTAWTKTFGGSSAEGARAIRQTRDGGYIIAGYTFSFGAGYADVYLIKLSAEGNLEWSGVYGGPGWEYGNSVAETPDGDYIVAGYTTSIGSGSRDVYLVKVDEKGNQIWEQAYGGPVLDAAKAVAVTPDGGYVVAGYTEFFGAGENDVYLLKVDLDGNEEWSRTFGGEAADMGMSVLVNTKGNYIMAGATGSFDARNRDFYLIEVNPQGHEIWSQNHGYGEFLPYEWGNMVIETQDGGYLIAGNSNVSTQIGSGELMNMYLVKTDEQGKEVWTSYIGRGQGYDYANAVREAGDGGYFVIGATKSGSDNNDAYLIKVSNAGDILWKKSFGDFGSEWGSDLVLTADGGVMIVGHTNSFGAGSLDIWLLKIPPDSGE